MPNNDSRVGTMSRAYPQFELTRRGFLQTAAGITAIGALGWPLSQAMAARESSLDAEINHYIRNLRRAGRVRPDESTAWTVYDFVTGTKLVAINEDRPLQSASMIKPFIAQAYFYRHGEDSRRYPYSEQSQVMMTAMIRDSSNSATNYFIDRIGSGPASRRPREVEYVLKRHAGGVFRQTSIVEYIPRSGRTYRNRASAHDYSRFLYAIWHEQLPFARDIKHYMSLPNGDRIKRGTDIIPQFTRIYDKTGSTAHLCGNMGIVEASGRDGRRYPYIFVGIIEKRRRAGHYGRWIRDRGDVIREVSDMVYDFMKHRHRLI